MGLNLFGSKTPSSSFVKKIVLQMIGGQIVGGNQANVKVGGTSVVVQTPSSAAGALNAATSLATTSSSTIFEASAASELFVNPQRAVFDDIDPSITEITSNITATAGDTSSLESALENFNLSYTDFQAHTDALSGVVESQGDVLSASNLSALSSTATGALGMTSDEVLASAGSITDTTQVSAIGASFRDELSNLSIRMKQADIDGDTALFTEYRDLLELRLNTYASTMNTLRDTDLVTQNDLLTKIETVANVQSVLPTDDVSRALFDRTASNVLREIEGNLD